MATVEAPTSGTNFQKITWKFNEDNGIGSRWLRFAGSRSLIIVCIDVSF